MRVKFPANYKIPPHTHPADEVVTVMEGDFHVGMGDKFDQSKGDGLNAGGFMTLPKGTQHYAWSTGGTVIQINAQGPSGTTYVNPADDPRKSQ